MLSDLKLLAKALLSGRALDAIIAEFGSGPGEDIPISLTGMSIDQLDVCRGSKIVPTAGVCRYLASDDDLTDDIIDSMELALESDYSVPEPFYIASMRERLNGRLVVRYFYLDKE